MKIDEVIAYEKNIVKNKKEYAEINCVSYEFYAGIEYHEQIANWLEELKEARKSFEENRKAGYEHGYVDAIRMCLLILYKNAGKFISNNFYCQVYEEVSEEMKKVGSE